MKSYTGALALLAATCSTTSAFIPPTTSSMSTSMTRVYSEATPAPPAPETPEAPVAAPKIEFSVHIYYLTTTLFKKLFRLFACLLAKISGCYEARA